MIYPEKRSEPLVSFIVPSYNHKKYIEECISSIYNNGYKHVEVIVIDDASTDGSGELLLSLQRKYGFKLILKEHNKGLVDSLNTALQQHVNGTYYKLASSDDILIEGCVEKVVDLFDLNRSVDVVIGNSYCINEQSRIIKEHRIKINGEKTYKNFLAGRIDYNITAAFYRTNIHDRIGLYEKGAISEDIYLNMKIWKHLAVEFADCFITGYRSHPANTTKKTWLMYQEGLKALESLREDEYYEVKRRRECLNFFVALSKDYKKESLKYLKGSIRYANERLFWVGILQLAGAGEGLKAIRAWLKPSKNITNGINQ